MGEVCDRKNQRPGLSLGAEAAALGFRGQVREMRLGVGAKGEESLQRRPDLGGASWGAPKRQRLGSRGRTALQARLPTGEGEPDLWEGPTSLWADWPLELQFVQEEGRESSRRRKPRVSPPRLQVGKGGKWPMPRRGAGGTAEGLGLQEH